MNFALIFTVATIFLGWSSWLQAAEKVFYPRPESTNDPRTEYPVKLLELALEKSGGQFRLHASDRVMVQSRAIAEVAIERGSVQVVWSMTSAEREQQLRPIRIPIYKGLIGWRLPLVRKADADRFSKVKNIADLKTFAAGQGLDWPDTQILSENGLKVHGAQNYEGLFQMLENGRFDYFPRAVIEIWPEAQAHADKGLVVDEHIAFHYPAAFYYFVNPRNDRLAGAIEGGLEKALKDGSYEKLFRAHFKSVIRRSKLDRRVIIELKNPLLPAETPLSRKELWFSPKASD